MINVSPTSIVPQYAFDHTGRLEAPQGWFEVTGWLAGPCNSCRVRLKLENGSTFDCECRLPRPDVAAAFPELPGAAQSGFRLATHLPAGLLIATLEYLPDAADTWLPAGTISILSGVSPLSAALDTGLPATPSAGEYYLNGWCFHPQEPITALSLRVGGRTSPVKYGIERPDVLASYPGYATAPSAGFAGHVYLHPGQSDLVLTAHLQSGLILQHVLAKNILVPDEAMQAAMLSLCETRARALRLPEAANPKVSLIIPVYNQLHVTLNCLESLVRHQGPISFEVIVIDDNSEAPVSGILGQVRNLRLHRNPTNRGFVLNCNHGAEMARGEYLFFLNNDTEVTAGWLESLLSVLAQRPDAGLVGAKFVYPNGRLQEAGGIIGQDGNGWNYGRDDDPDRPEYNYLRRVDYCSGAGILITREFFLGLGGFDSRYQPAYYEDTDLAFAVRKAGREVYYQPGALIIHHEGVSSGTDINSGVKRYQAINRDKFTSKWADDLAHYSADPSLIAVARDRHAPCRILVLDACALTPDADSGSLRMFNLLLMLTKQGAKVTFAATNLQAYEPYSTRLRLSGVEHLIAPHVTDLKMYLTANAHVFDVIILSRKSVAAEFMPIVRKAASNARVVFDTVDLMYLRLERQAMLEQSESLRAQAAESRTAELELCSEADLVFVVSSVEADLLAREIAHEKIALISNIHSLHPSKTPFKERSGLMFVGGFQHPPNADAMLYFLNDILPLIRRFLPTLPVHIVGSNMPDNLRKIAAENVHMHGFVPDLSALYEQVRLTVAPLRYGAGVKGKVNQSMAHGVPVVATSPATEGMHLRHEKDVLVADDATAFAAAVVRLHEDEQLWQRIASGGLQNIEDHFSFAAVERKLFTALPNGLFQRKGVLQPLPRRPAPDYTMGQTLFFSPAGNAQPYQREGWAAAEGNSCWITGNMASLDFRLRAGDIPRKLRAKVYPFLAPPRIPRQRVQLLAGNQLSPHEAVVTLADGPTELIWDLPEFQRTTNCCFYLTITFRCPDAVAPSALGTSPDLRKLSVAFLELTLLG